jgi:intracellular sulfur oxidation DsrE/DsrF family protein
MSRSKELKRLSDKYNESVKCESVDDMLENIQNFVKDNPGCSVDIDDNPLALTIGFKAVKDTIEFYACVRMLLLRQYKDKELFMKIDSRKEIAKRLMAGEKLA